MRTILTFISLITMAYSLSATELIGRLELIPAATANSEGIFLNDVVTNRSEQPLPRIKLAAPPLIGRPISFSRAQVANLLTQAAPELVCSNWMGAERIKITRATRVINEALLKELLTEIIQREYVKDRGELDLRFNRPWNPVVASDDPISIKVLEMPTSGVSASFICRFELIAGQESVGIYQQPLSAKVWKEVFVAGSNITRGQSLRDADITMERRDVVNNRDYLTELPLENPHVEFRENLQAGTQITARTLRLRAIIKRGRQVDAIARDGGLTISVRAEALEDGVPGQMLRVRNIRSKREFKGKVQDEQTVVVAF